MAGGHLGGAPGGRDGAVALLERREELDASLASPSHARRLLRKALSEVSREEWIDVAELAVSEVVTNAVLHAHSSIDLLVRVYEDEVCVEVRDFSTTLPLQRNYEAEATTGRGMGLVSTLARSCGVRPLGDVGKVVWFCVGDLPALPEWDDPLAGWDLDERAEDNAARPVADVELRSMPATLWLSARQHHDAIIRELTLYVAEHPEVDVDLASADAARTWISDAVVAAVAAAQETGLAEPVLPAGHPSPLPWVPKQLDLRLSVSVDSASQYAALQDVLDTAERLAVEGQLLAHPAQPEIVAVRDWACEQVIAQIAGAAPSPWPGTDQERFEHDRNEARHPRTSSWDGSYVRDATARVIAADESNRILAVSPPLAALLGWEPSHLVGRRVVTVIPPALREAHIAGVSAGTSAPARLTSSECPSSFRSFAEMAGRSCAPSSSNEHPRTATAGSTWHGSTLSRRSVGHTSRSRTSAVAPPAAESAPLADLGRRTRHRSTS